MDHQFYKEVYFDAYCRKCRNEGLKETDEPCEECLSEPTNWNSHRPVKYEKKETKR